MSKAAALRKRLDAIQIALQGTLTAKIRSLTDDERRAYRAWQQRCQRHYERYPDAQAYERELNGEPPPPLPYAISEKLFGAPSVITTEMTIEQVQVIYHAMLNKD